MRWMVDGMNVIGSRPDGWWRDRDRAMARLVDLLERFAAETGDDVTVVFERKPRPALKSSVIEIAHAPKPGRDAADFEIARRVEADAQPGSIHVGTSDRWLANRVSEAGAVVQGADGFRTRIEED